MEAQLTEDEIQALQEENKTLKGKIRGYQRLGPLFQDLKKENRQLKIEQEKKAKMVSTSTEMDIQSPLLPSNPKTLAETVSMSAEETERPLQVPTEVDDTFMKTAIQPDESLAYISGEASKYSDGSTILALEKKLQESLNLVQEFERKRNNDKKLFKILNEKLKKTVKELETSNENSLKFEQENHLLLKKIAKLERERDCNSFNVGTEMENTEDWVHLQNETQTNPEESENSSKEIVRLQEKCKQLEEKAKRWEDEHFNLQMEYTNHTKDLRGLLEMKSKELICVTESLNQDKKTLESKFKSLEIRLKKQMEEKENAHELHLETLKRYKSLERKFLALEEQNRNSLTGSSQNPIPENTEQFLMLNQQMTLFKEDFENERKERIKAEKASKNFEEKFHNTVKQLEKTKTEFLNKERNLKEMISENTKLMQKIKTLETNYKKVSDHNYMLMELQSKMSETKTPTVIKKSVPKLPNLPLTWSCKACTFNNDPQAEICKICKAPKRYTTDFNYFESDLTIDGPLPEFPSKQ